MTPLLFVTFAFFLRLIRKVYNMWFITPLFWDGLCGFEVFKPLNWFVYPLHFHSPLFKPWAMFGYCFLYQWIYPFPSTYFFMVFVNRYVLFGCLFYIGNLFLC